MAAKKYSEEEIVFIEHPSGSKFSDKTGVRFGRLLVIGFAGPSNSGRSMWFCKCDCGNVTRVDATSLTGGISTSCGCFRSEKTSERRLRHGHSINKTPEYSTWTSVLTRTQNPKCKKFPQYGGRGIKICDRWKVFENFLKDMGNKPGPEYSIERDDVNGDYRPDNCRWATPKEQANNTRRNHPLTYNGRTQNIGQWAEELGIGSVLILKRLEKLGWTIEEALSTPVRYQSPRKSKINQQ